MYAEVRRGPVYLELTWLDDHARKVSKRVTAAYRDTFRVHLSPRFASMPLEQLRRADVKRLVGELVDSGKHRNTIWDIVTPLRAMLREALRDEVIATNPAADVEVPESAPTRATDVPTRQELDRIIQKARSDDSRDAIRLMAALGCESVSASLFDGQTSTSPERSCTCGRRTTASRWPTAPRRRRAR